MYHHCRMSEVPCDGPCNSRWRKADAEYRKALADYDPLDSAQSRPSPPEVYPVYGDPWCPRCKNQIHEQLAQIDDAAAILAALPPSPNDRGDDKAGKVSGSKAQPSPSSRMDDLEELGEWLRSWESSFRPVVLAVGGLHEDPKPHRGWLATEITTITAWLVFHFDKCITHPDFGQDFGREVRRWHREMQEKARAGQVDKHVKKPCPRCRLYTLWARDGEDYVRCINEDCNRRMTREELAAMDMAA
jgi:phage FluMu protein Com